MTTDKEGPQQRPQLAAVEGGKNEDEVTDDRIVESLIALFQTLAQQDTISRDNIVKVGHQIVQKLHEETDRVNALQARVDVLEACSRRAVQELAPGLTSK